jgi:hypothetical protein
VQSGANKAVYVNCQNNATLNFSKIRAMIIDNSQNGSDIEIIFPDTETTVSIPAYTPYAIIPVFTNQTQFYVVSPLSQPSDKTSFTILNTAPPPIAVPTTQEQNFYTSTGINATTSGNSPLIAAGISGTIEAISIRGFMQSSPGNVSSVTLTLQDGNGDVFISTGGICGGALTANIVFSELADLRLRFQNGLKLVWVTTGSPIEVFLWPNIYYRTP